MYPNFKNKSDRERKYKELQKQVEQDLAFENIKQQVYKTAIWAGDAKANTINLTPGQNTVGTQTGHDEVVGSQTARAWTPERSARPSSGVFSINLDNSNINSSIGPSQSSSTSTQTRIINTDRSIQTRPSTSDMATSMETPLRSELDMMRDEDYQSDLLRHQDYILDQKSEINRQSNMIRSQKMEINSLKRQIEGMDIQFHNAKVQFERLAHEHTLSQRQISQLHHEFEQGRQLYLSLRAAAETIEYERDLTINELDALKGNFAAGEELYNALGEAYRLLQQESAKTSANYESTIEKLKQENATATARIVEQQQQMMKSAVSETASKNIRSNMNTPQALREYMQQMGVEETPAATSFSTVSNKILFVIIDGKLHRRQYGKPDRNLEENTVASREALNGVDPIYTMLAIKHSIPPGVRISDNKLYKQEATEIRESGKLLTHEEAHELNARARRNLPAIEDPSSLSTPKPTDKRNRGESFYKNTTPIVEEKKKLKVSEGTLRPYRGEEIGFAKLNLRGRGLMGAGVNGTTNLREAVGASRMDYKPLGSKFIRLADLHNNVLNLKHNNRTSAMNKLKMSDALTKIIKELTFDGNINQQLYNSLPHSEQNVLVKVLKLTHLYYSDKSVLEDPNKRLIQEFNKLRGEVALGNNNPDLIRELKLITVDLHAQKMISDKDFRSILVNLP